MPEALPHSHGHRAPPLPLYCGRQPHQRHNRRGHPPPCREPAAIGPRRQNSPHPRDPHPPPVLRHHLPAVEPDQRRRTAAGLTADRTPVELPPLPPLPSTPSATPSPWRVGPTPRRCPPPSPRAVGPSEPKARPPARSRQLGRNPPGPASWEILYLFPFPFLFPIFTYIYLDTNILCTKNSLNKL
jgi:hypothetical protein